MSQQSNDCQHTQDLLLVPEPSTVAAVPDVEDDVTHNDDICALAASPASLGPASTPMRRSHPLPAVVTPITKTTPCAPRTILRSTSKYADETCPICLCAFGKDASVYETKCHHIFHRKCIDQAKGRRPVCPLCRTELTPIVKTTEVSLR